MNAAWERAIVIYDRGRVWVTKRREKGSGDANRLRSIPRFPDSWPGNERIEGSGLPGQKSFLVLRLHDAFGLRARRYAVTQLLRLRNKWRDYCFTILSLGALVTREYMGVQCTPPGVFCRWRTRRRFVDGVEASLQAEGTEANWPTGPGQWIAAPGRPLFPFHQLSQINRLIHRHVPITT